MIRPRVFRVFALAAALAFEAGSARSQQIAPPVQDMASPIGAEPVNLELSTPVAPMQMRAEDAQRLIERLGVPTTAPAPAAAPQAVPAAHASNGVSRTISVEAPAVVNKSSQFVFKDVTEREKPASPKLTPAQRHAAVEAYRQSLATKRRVVR
jgi:hypothetical protein